MSEKQEQQPAQKMCKCNKSLNKPYCDGSHKK
jgi:CDGSH-type Zn-finger protein